MKLSATILIATAAAATALAQEPGVVVSPLAAQARALLVEKCLACHGDDAKKIKGDYDMRTRDGMMRGGESGEAAIVAHDAEKSPLWLAVTRRDQDFAMPPKVSERLSEAEVTLLRQWIEAGAPWAEKATARMVKEGSAADGVTVTTSGGQSEEWTTRRYQPADLWAYQPIQNPAVPAARAEHPLDAFLLEKLAAKGVTGFAPAADARTLIRRAAFDLTGLPPKPEDVDAFTARFAVAAPRAQAFAECVQQLLASPHYGEQQTQHWLDVVRYADSNGFANDFERPNAWRYRDYVVRSFNADKPFDRFVTEQLAGDELAPGDPEMLIAAGFLRSGPWEHTAMTVAAVTRQQYLDDVTHAVGVTFLAQGLRCAQCHDHKFDPVPTQDYYRIQSVFAPVQFAERALPFLPAENTHGFELARVPVEARIAVIKQQEEELGKKNKDAIAGLLAKHRVKKMEELPASERPAKDYLGPTYGLSQTDLSLRKLYKKALQTLDRELKRFEPLAFTVYSGPPNGYASTKAINPVPKNRDGVVPVVHILPNGSIESPAAAVTPGVLSPVFGSNDRLEASEWNTIPSTTEGRRLALARWIASPKNTLTARVIVNRVWQQHFGTGIVATPNNFGKMGAHPTHPELLDWLATWFMENGWSLKKLHALIMSSAAYQQGGARDGMEKLREVDARNSLLAYFPARRLAAEEIRDGLLAVTGELNPELGGPGVFPEINWEVALQPRHVMGSVAPAYLPSPTPDERNRRTLYAFRHRTLNDPLLEVFNRPGSEISCEKRDATTVTPQAFALFNSEYARARALALAAACAKDAPRLDAQLTRAFRAVYAREPSATERTACSSHFQRMLAYHRGRQPVPEPLPTKVQRNMIEELTGEKVEWEETLPGMDRYQRDLQPWEVTAEVRALSEVCLALLNSNEFLYVR